MNRLKKWDKNYNAANAGERQMAYKHMIKEQLAVHFAFAEKLENAVKQIMGESGLPTWHNIPYLNFARRIAKLYGRYSGLMLKNEIALLIKLSCQNQLKYRLLVKIRDAVNVLLFPASVSKSKD